MEEQIPKGRAAVLRALELAQELQVWFDKSAHIDIHGANIDDILVDSDNESFTVKRLSPETISLKKQGITFFVSLASHTTTQLADEKEGE